MNRLRGGTVFIDYLLITVLVLLVILVPPEPVRTSPIEQRAEFIITVTWPDRSSSDVDTWFRAPTGELISFTNKQEGIYHLDKDDTGRAADTVTLPDGTVRETRINQEIVTMRGWVPGTYVVNLHLYAMRDEEPVPATVTIMRVSPFETVLERQIVLDMQGQEETVAQFEIGENGEVLSISHDFTPLARRGPMS
jgi:hypothetical protein